MWLSEKPHRTADQAPASVAWCNNESTHALTILIPTRLRLSRLLLLLLTTVTLAAPARRTSAAEFTFVSVGYQRTAHAGVWMPVKVAATGLNPLTETALVVTTINPRGNRVTTVVESGQTDSQGRVQLSGLCRSGRMDARLDVSLQSDSNIILCKTSMQCIETNLPADTSAIQPQLRLCRYDIPFLLTIGETAGLPELLERAQSVSPQRPNLLGLHVDSVEELPRDTRGYDGFSTVLFNGAVSLTEQQFDALRLWVISGGHLIISCSEQIAELLVSPLGQWLTTRFDIQPETRIVTDHDLAALQEFVPRSTRITTFRRTAYRAHIRSQQPVYLAESRNSAMIARVGAGSGIVTFLPVNLNARPVSQWNSLPELYAMLILGAPVTHAADHTGSARISSIGVSDLATQLMASVDARPATGRWSTWGVMAMAFTWLLLIGPIDYALVVLLLKRPQATWVTFPLWVLAGTLVLFWLRHDPSPGPVLNSVHVVDVVGDRDESMLQTLSFLSLSVPNTKHADLEAVASSELGPAVGDVLLTWSARPESVYGGLYRAGGISRGQYSYRQSLDSPAVLKSVPFVVDGSFELQCSWTRQTQPTLIETDLAVSGFGLLEGRFTHHLPTPLRDWIIVHGNRVYQSRGEDRAALPAGQTWESRQGSAWITDLKSWLSGPRVAREDPVRGIKASTAGQVAYNPRSQDSLDIVTIMSLYETAGGGGYTGLGHHAFSRLEVSDSIRMNYALVLGWIDEPATDLSLNGELLTPKESNTIVRMLLPVDRQPARSRAKMTDEIEEARKHPGTRNVVPNDARDTDPTSTSKPARD